MEKNKIKHTKPEVDIKIPLIFSFILMTMGMVIGLSSDKYSYWGIQEKIVASEQVGLLGLMSYHTSLFVMIMVFIKFGHSKIIHWLSLIVVFGTLGFFVFNSGSCLTEKGLYEKEFSKTIYYSFEEIETYEIKKHESINDDKTYQYNLYLKNGEKYTFNKKDLDGDLLLRINESIMLAKGQTE
ncbi:hypothetical protein CVD28_01830 [Bacillus sp. M6-12]|uniref:hypothetical protein n=1 Tax=Bacillus sp. M6-12 TaxID=2054166 RepID=UPI000C78D364|nr:hypothetical protein [Bacillus sp. M6-12]PLS19171.1 hypothetical protein CVD28_01830 [Bacillus sp. M6-12]